ncbi:MAG: cysteine rich repeat-containing protein [Rhodopila sp.]
MGGHRAIVTVACSFALFSLAVSVPRAQAQQLTYCKADTERLCSDVRPGGGRLEQCLKAHENDISVGCAKELKQMKSQRGR